MRPYAREVAYIDPLRAFASFSDEPFAVFLDSADPGMGRGRYSYIARDPVDTFLAHVEGCENPFGDLSSCLGDHKFSTHPELPPFQTGICGVLGYELGQTVERLPPPKSGPLFPDLAVGLFDTVAAFDHQQKRAWIIGSEIDSRRPPAATRVAALAESITAASALSTLRDGAGAAWTWNLNADAYTEAVCRAVEYIFAGDIFQANITARAEAQLQEPAFDVYRRLRRLSPAPFSAFVRVDEAHALISASPERFLSVRADGSISTRPIKGTRPRADSPEEDAANAVELTESIKDKAENLMIVDLLRNDISRVAEVGSVGVTSLYELETFASVHHLVSEIVGRLQADRTAVDLLRAAFPGGSITGAPKIRAMEIINEIEPHRRGPYCGSVFWAGFDGAMDSSIVIRSLIASGEKIYAHAGCGIVADSDPLSEYDEMRTKAAPLLAAVLSEGEQ